MRRASFSLSVCLPPLDSRTIGADVVDDDADVLDVSAGVVVEDDVADVVDVAAGNVLLLDVVVVVSLGAADDGGVRRGRCRTTHVNRACQHTRTHTIRTCAVSMATSAPLPAFLAIVSTLSPARLSGSVGVPCANSACRVCERVTHAHNTRQHNITTYNTNNAHLHARDGVVAHSDVHSRVAVGARGTDVSSEPQQRTHGLRAGGRECVVRMRSVYRQRMRLRDVARCGHTHTNDTRWRTNTLSAAAASISGVECSRRELMPVSAVRMRCTYIHIKHAYPAHITRSPAKHTNRLIDDVVSSASALEGSDVVVVVAIDMLLDASVCCTPHVRACWRASRNRAQSATSLSTSTLQRVECHRRSALHTSESHTTSSEHRDTCAHTYTAQSHTLFHAPGSSLCGTRANLSATGIESSSASNADDDMSAVSVGVRSCGQTRHRINTQPKATSRIHYSTYTTLLCAVRFRCEPPARADRVGLPGATAEVTGAIDGSESAAASAGGGDSRVNCDHTRTTHTTMYRACTLARTPCRSMCAETGPTPRSRCASACPRTDAVQWRL
jgi:hypothetical protein